jgi:hypothetical protein
VPVHSWSCVASLTKRAPAAAVHAEQVQSCPPGANNCEYHNPNQFLYAYNAMGKLKGSLQPLYVTPAGTSLYLPTCLYGHRTSFYLSAWFPVPGADNGTRVPCGMQPAGVEQGHHFNTALGYDFLSISAALDVHDKSSCVA